VTSVVETNAPFTIMPAALNRHIVSSAGYNWLKQGPVNQPGGHRSVSLSVPECNEKFFQEFQVSGELKNVCCKVVRM